MAKRGSRSSVFADDVVEANRAEHSVRNRTPPWAVVYKAYVWVAIALFPFALLGMIVEASGSLKHATHQAGQTRSTATSSAGRAAATLELQQWLAAATSPLPGGKILFWDSAAVLKPATAQLTKQGTAGGPPVSFRTELDSFTVIGADQHTYTATVQVALDPRGGGAEALGGPSLIPTTPPADDGWANGGPWPGLDADAQISSSVHAAITGWANAYTSGSSDALRLAVGDTAGSHTYLPLSGVSSVTATPISAATYGGPGSMIVQIGLDIVWNGQKPATDDSQTGDTPQTTMDLLVARANTAAPVVVAWGPPGSGPTLKAHQNAVSAPALPSTSPSEPGN